MKLDETSKLTTGSVHLDGTGLMSLEGVFFPGRTVTVILDHNKLTNIAGVPAEIVGAFSCEYNALRSLKGGPKHVTSYFSVAFNLNLRSLEGGPEKVGSSYYCQQTAIKSFKGIAKEIGLSVYASGCKLTSLEGLDVKFLEDFDVSYNSLTDLVSAPTQDVRELDASNNKLESLKGAPAHVRKLFLERNSTLTSLHGIGTQFIKSAETIKLTGCPIESHALGLVLVHDLDELRGDFPGIEILKKYIGQGENALIDCQHALIEAGYEDLAQL